MESDVARTERLRNVISKLESMTRDGEVHWEKQAGSAHRYAQLRNNLFILGPATTDTDVPRYLFITPFDSPDHVEINSDDPELGSAVMALSREVEKSSAGKPAIDPFAVTEQLLERLESM